MQSISSLTQITPTWLAMASSIDSLAQELKAEVEQGKIVLNVLWNDVGSSMETLKFVLIKASM